jgi:FPC/CPF motif-containing protein YcgG
MIFSENKHMGNIVKREGAPVQEFRNFLEQRLYPCIAAKAAAAAQNIHCMVAGHLGCPGDDYAILDFLYAFIDGFRNSKKNYHSAAVIFLGTSDCNEEIFDRLMWKRLQSLSNADAKKYSYDTRVSSDPSSAQFSFSLKQEAFYIIGLHPWSSRKARRFIYPTLVFNPHQQFEALRKTDKYEPIKNAIRRRDVKFSGSVNPMLQDFGISSEAFQYSGRRYDQRWRCPLKINHADNNHSAT